MTLCPPRLKLVPNTQTYPWFLCTSCSSFARQGPATSGDSSLGSGLYSLGMGPSAVIDVGQQFHSGCESRTGEEKDQEKKGFLWNTEKTVFENFLTSWE